MKKFSTALAVAFLAVSAFAAPESYTIDKNHSEATFRVRHMMSRVSGKFNEFDATINLDREAPTASNVEFTIKTASINTGVEGRDKHLRSADFFDAEKNPDITFKSTAIAAAAGKKDTYNVTGDFTMHGVTKRITIPVEFLGFMKDPRGTERAGFSIRTTLNRKDYNINWNRALDAGGALLSDDVDIDISLETIKAPPAAK